MQTMNSRYPKWAKFFMMCQRIGLPPTSTIGFGRYSVSSRNRVPSPPARSTTFMEINPRTLRLCRAASPGVLPAGPEHYPAGVSPRHPVAPLACGRHHPRGEWPGAPRTGVPTNEWANDPPAPHPEGAVGRPPLRVPDHRGVVAGGAGTLRRRLDDDPPRELPTRPRLRHLLRELQ